MNKTFKNSSQVGCIFTEEGVRFTGAQQEVYFPYGCLDSIKMSLLGVLQASCGSRICSFAVDRADRAGVKEMVRFARDAMTSAPEAEPQVVDLKAGDNLVAPDLSLEEKLQAYKALFIQGVISREEYDARKRQLKNG